MGEKNFEKWYTQQLDAQLKKRAHQVNHHHPPTPIAEYYLKKQVGGRLPAFRIYRTRRMTTGVTSQNGGALWPVIAGIGKFLMPFLKKAGVYLGKKALSA